MKNKRQHFVPQSYLKAWCDPGTPAWQEPYVWLYEKEGDGVRRKSPAKVFVETDFYTIKVDDVERDLRLEHGLSQLEARFAALRQNKLCLRLPITLRDHMTSALSSQLCMPHEVVQRVPARAMAGSPRHDEAARRPRCAKRRPSRGSRWPKPWRPQ